MRSVIWKQPKRQVGTDNDNQQYIIADVNTNTLSCRYDTVSAAEILRLLGTGCEIDGLRKGSNGKLEETCSIQSSIAVMDVEIGRNEHGSLTASYGDRIVYWASDEWHRGYRKRQAYESSRDVPYIEYAADLEAAERINSKLAMLGAWYRIDCFGNIMYNDEERVTVPEITKYVIEATFEDSGIKQFKSVHGAVIGQHAFADSDLEEAVIKSEKICEYAFECCRRLKRIEILEGTKEVCLSAFNRCVELKALTIPKGTVCVGKCSNRELEIKNWLGEKIG